MPWTGSSFARHNSALTGSEASHAARMANHVLANTGNEGEAIATANKFYQHRDDGGGVYQGNPGDLNPSNATASPMTQGMIQRYSSMPPEKLQELAAMLAGTPQGQVVQRVLTQKHAMPQPTTQPAMQRRGGATPRREGGGSMSLGTLDPSWSRGELRAADQGAGATGYLHGSTSGRADHILTTAPAGSYVVPADVISGLGEGNSLAGAAVMQRILATGPGGTPLPHAGARSTMPRPPAAPQVAKGGTVPGGDKPTPVALSHGEFVISPEHVAHWGEGDLSRGHRIFDTFVLEMRKQLIKTLQKLPGPVGSKKEKKAA